MGETDSVRATFEVALKVLKEADRPGSYAKFSRYASLLGVSPHIFETVTRLELARRMSLALFTAGSAALLLKASRIPVGQLKYYLERRDIRQIQLALPSLGFDVVSWDRLLSEPIRLALLAKLKPYRTDSYGVHPSPNLGDLTLVSNLRRLISLSNDTDRQLGLGAVLSDIFKASRIDLFGIVLNSIDIEDLSATFAQVDMDLPADFDPYADIVLKRFPGGIGLQILEDMVPVLVKFGQLTTLLRLKHEGITTLSPKMLKLAKALHFEDIVDLFSAS